MQKGMIAIANTENVRLDRFLANMSFGSRTEVKQSIKSGRVTVNGQVCRDPGRQVDTAADLVELNGVTVAYQAYIYLMLNKPAGVVSATEDRRESTVLDLIDPRYMNKGLFPVGRLDKDTEGLLLLTNHGDLGHRLLSPRKHVIKRYYARVAGLADARDQQAFREGIVLDDGYRTLPGELEIRLAGEVSEVEIAIREGKFHQIKRMFQALGKPVLYLKRVTMGPLVLDETLRLGEYRPLTADEVRQLNTESQ